MLKIDVIGGISIFMLSFNILIFCPILIYYLLMYRKYERKPIIHQRNSLLVYVINILAIFTNCTERVYMVLSQVLCVIDVPIWTVSFFLALTWWALMDLFAIKVYHLYYQQQYNQSIADQSWKRNINPHENDWYITNKKKYGNPVYLIKITFIPYLISVIIDSIIFSFLLGGGLLLDFSHLTLATIPICIAMYVFWKARKLNDVYSIRNEIFYQFVILLTTLSIYMIIFMVCHYMLPSTDNHHIQRFEWMTYLFITDGVTFSLSLFSTMYPLYLTKQKKIEAPLLELERDPEYMSTVKGMQGINSMISNYESFKAFMEYLVSEFSAENLLFMVELIQIKHQYQVRNNNLVRIPKKNVISSQFLCIDGNDDREEKVENTLDLEEQNSSLQKKDNNLFQVIDFNINPNNIDRNNCIDTYLFHNEGLIMTQICLTALLPLSLILIENENNLYLEMKALYNKYIKRESDHELNISYLIRDPLITYFEGDHSEDKHYKLFNIMDECCVEIIQLLKSSFARFVKSDKFKEIINGDNKETPQRNVNHSSLNKKLEKLPVIRNASSYSMLKIQYAQ